MSAIFYYTGATVWASIAIALVAFILIALWIYLSTTISYWWVRVRAADMNPDSETIGEDFTGKRFWKLKLLWLIIKNFKWVVQVIGSTLRGDYWKADFTGLVPRVKAWRNS